MDSILDVKPAGEIVIFTEDPAVAKLEPIQKLTRELRETAKSLSAREVRYLVDSYYQIQEYRLRAANQVRDMFKSGESNDLVEWMFNNTKSLENNIKKALDSYTNANPVGRWSKSICGIGPVISAGLIAHINIEKAPTVGHIWRYAGLDPSTKWGKGQLRPWNAQLKRLCWLIGQSFVKVSNNPKDIYGHLYRERKLYEANKNESGEYSEQANYILSNFNYRKNTESYKYYSQGKLPPAHIDQRAQRWAVKLFLAHWHEVAYEMHYGRKPPKPYAIAHLDHAHIIEPPGIVH